MNSTRQRFEELEWRMIREAPLLAGLGVFVPSAGPNAFGGEVAALVRTLVAAPYHYEHDALVLAALAPNGDVTARREHPASAEEVLEHVKVAVRLVEEKAPEHASPYKDLVLEVARSAAQVSRTSSQVPQSPSPGEELPFMRQLRAILQREQPQPAQAPSAPPASFPPQPPASHARPQRNGPARWFGSIVAKLHSLVPLGPRPRPLVAPQHVERGPDVLPL
jgi:hypothetical protein